MGLVLIVLDTVLAGAYSLTVLTLFVLVMEDLDLEDLDTVVSDMVDLVMLGTHSFTEAVFTTDPILMEHTMDMAGMPLLITEEEELQ